MINKWPNNDAAGSQSEGGKYPEALSRDAFREGGYTFLHRVFRTHFQTGKPVVINSGRNYFQYKFEPHHQTFAEGLTLLEGDDRGAKEALMGVANSFSLNQAFKEGNIKRPE